MLRSLQAARRLSPALSCHMRFSHRTLSTGATAPPPAVPTLTPPLQPQPPPHHEQQREEAAKAAAAAEAAAEAARNASAEAEATRTRSRGRVKGGDYDEEHEKILRAALGYVPKLGWSETALLNGARDVGVSPAIVGSFPKKEGALVEFFMDDCLQKLIDKIDSSDDLGALIMSERISKLLRYRLEMQAPFISKWPQALSIQSQPMNLPTSLKQRAMLVDEVWHAAGDQASDIDWYVKRTVLGGIYSSSEIFMLTDHSPEFRDTWSFLDRRVKDAFDLQKTVQEAAYLAEAVGAGLGNSMQGFMKRVFQG